MKRWFTKLASRFLGNCREATEGCTDLAEGAMSEADRARVQRHLRICGACKAYKAQMETSVRALRELPRDELEETEKQQLLRRFREKSVR